MANSKLKYMFMVDDVAYDLSTAEPLPVEGKTGAELAEMFNRMCTVAAGIADFDPEGKKTGGVTKFKDKEAGQKRIAALHSSIVAHAAGVRAEENRAAEEKAAKRTEKAEKPAKEPKAAKEPSTGKRGKAPTFHLKVIKLGGTPSRAKRFADYRDGMTVGEWAEAAVAASLKPGRKTRSGMTHERDALYALALGDVRYDAAKGVIDLRDPR